MLFGGFMWAGVPGMRLRFRADPLHVSSNPKMNVQHTFSALTQHGGAPPQNTRGTAVVAYGTVDVVTGTRLMVATGAAVVTGIVVTGRAAVAKGTAAVARGTGCG